MSETSPMSAAYAFSNRHSKSRGMILRPRSCLFGCVHNIPQLWQHTPRITHHHPARHQHFSTTSPILFLLGGPGAGKGTQSNLLISEFGADVQGRDDGTVVDAEVKQRVERRWPRRKEGGRRVGAVHVSIGALLREELHREKEGQGKTRADSSDADTDTGMAAAHSCHAV
jgi:hypothetical protein